MPAEPPAEPARVRPLSARQIVVSTLLGVDPPRLPSRHLVRAGALFGIREGATRVALSRMVAAGELDQTNGAYALTDRWQVRRARQAEGRRPELRTWTGDWVQWVVVSDARSASARARLREATRALHLAELREGVWMRPDNMDPDRLLDAAAVVTEQCLGLLVRPEPDEADGHLELVGRLWNLAGWQGQARTLLAAVDGQRDLLECGVREALPHAWELSAAVLRHLLADPLLPPELLPDDWPGAVLREHYDRFDDAFKVCWRQLMDEP